MASHDRPAKKRRVSAHDQQSVADASAPITSARQLTGALSDYQDAGVGLKRFRGFLHQCSAGPDTAEDAAARNRAILAEYLDTQCVTSTVEDDGETEPGSYRDLMQTWRWASQKNTLGVLSLVPSTLASLLRLCSTHDELKRYGVTLVKVLLSASSLKIVYRNLTSSKDYVVSPALRLLTEMNRFDFGSMCSTLHSAFDFTIKDLPRNLDPPRGAPKASDEDPKKPSVRTLFVRFLLSFFQHGGASIKSELLGLRAWMTPIFRNLKTDSPALVKDVLDTMFRKVLADKDIPNSAKTSLFNEWVLGQIAQGYSRDEVVKVYKAGKEEEKTLASVIHDFLIATCTNPGNGISFPDHGWYPRSFAEGDEKRKSGPSIFNRTLSSFIDNIRPYADSLQLDLVLAIFRAFPELVAHHFTSTTSFSFEPKLTSTWIGYCTFLSETISLPLPENFGAKDQQLVPPPATVVVQNILPRPITKAVMNQCLTNKNLLIRFLGTRLLVVAFQKLRSVLAAFDNAIVSFVDPLEQWSECRYEVLEEFCRRIPDISAITGTFGKADSAGTLLSEARTRLLAEYYAALPDMAMAGKLDVNHALAKFVELKSQDEIKGLKLLEMGHMLQVAKKVPDVKWWNKPASMAHSPFVSFLMLCCTLPVGLPMRQVQDLLQSFSSTSDLFQQETAVPVLDALIESLQYFQHANETVFEPVLSLVDQAITHCSRVPFKYLDDFAQLLLEVVSVFPEAQDQPPVSPFTFALVEQWNFFVDSNTLQSQQKAAGVEWLCRFLESSVLIGENRFVISELGNRLLKSTKDKAPLPRFSALKNSCVSDSELAIQYDPDGTVSVQMHTEGKCVHILRPLFTSLGLLSLAAGSAAAAKLLNNVAEPTLLDLVVLQRAVVAVAKSNHITGDDEGNTLQHLFSLMQTVVRGLTSVPEEAERTERFLVREAPCLELFINFSHPSVSTGVVWKISAAYAKLLSEVFWNNEAVLRQNSGFLLKRVGESIEYAYQTKAEVHEETTTVYHSILPLILNPTDARALFNTVWRCLSRQRNSALEDIFGVLLSYLVTQEGYLDAYIVETCLHFNSQTETALSALARSMLHCPLDDFCRIATHLGRTDVIPVSPAVFSHISNSSGVTQKAERVAALLNALSDPVPSSQHEWKWKDTTRSTKALLERLFTLVADDCLETVPERWRTEALPRATCLFPMLDQPKSLKDAVEKKHRLPLGASDVLLVDSLIGPSDPAELPEMKAWYLKVFDHLTRRFAEDAVLTPKTRGLSLELNHFLGRRKIKVANAVPRATLNAVLEAALQKHIDVVEVVIFATRLVSLASPKSLDVAKLLQMVLGHEQNPLTERGVFSETSNIHRYLVFLLQKLFIAGKASAASISTLDGLLTLYRGTNDFVDRTLLSILTQLEAHLARSPADRIAAMSIPENAEGKPLIARTRNSTLNLTVDAKHLTRSIFLCSSQDDALPLEATDDLDAFVKATQEQDAPLARAYDPRFLLPVLAYTLVAPERNVDAQQLVDRHCIAYALTALSSSESTIRRMARSYLGACVTALESSTYRGKVQVNHLLCAVLTALESADADTPIPVTVAIFLAQAAVVLGNAAHFMYGKVMELLLSRPVLALHDLPYLLSFKQIGEEDTAKETAWILNILAAGLRTELDLEIFRRRGVFGWVLNLWAAPYTTERTREKVLELLWNGAGVRGGATTLVTRQGVLAWCEQVLASGAAAEGMGLERLRARLYDGSARGYVKTWSRGGVGMLFKSTVEGQ